MGRTTIRSYIEILSTIFLSFLGWSFFIPTICIFGIIYRTILDIFLRLTLDKKSYGGLLSYRDNSFFSADVSKFCITCVLYVRSSKPINVTEKFKKVLQKQVFDKPEDYPKLTSIRKSFAGYSYWIKNRCNIDDVLFPLDNDGVPILNEEALKEITGKITSSDHPKNNSILWDVYVSEKPMDYYDKNDGFYRYPVITRFHHSVGDGTSLVAMIIRFFASEKCENYSENLFKNLVDHNSKRPETLKETLMLQAIKFSNFLTLVFEVIFLALGRATKTNLLRANDNHVLHARNYSGDKIAGWACEDRIECFPMIKNIKKRTNTKFVAVLNTAITVSMTNYFKRNNFAIPYYITAGMTTLLDFPKIDPEKPVQLENKAAFAIFEVPTHVKANQKETLNLVERNIAQQMKHSDILIGRFILYRVLGSMPLNFINNSTAGFDSMTYLVSNVPGSSRMKMFDNFNDCVLEKVVPFAPSVKGFGVSIALMTYDDRLNVGILIDKKLVKSQKEVQKIAEDILDSIRTLNAELDSAIN